MAKRTAYPAKTKLAPPDLRPGDSRKNRTVSMSGDLWERVGIAAGRHVDTAGRALTRGELIEALISPYLERYVVQVRGIDAATGDDSPGSPAETLPISEAMTPSDGEEGTVPPGRGGETGDDQAPAPRRRRV